MSEKIKIIALLGLILAIGLFIIPTTTNESLTTSRSSSKTIESKDYSEWMKSMVRIEIPLNDGKSLIAGSGWIISSDGTIITNYHVIKEMIDGKAKEINVEFSDGTSAIATVVGGDEVGDVGIIKVTVVKELRPMPIADSSKAKMGQEVFILGNPLDQGLTLTHGILTSPLEYVNEFPLAYFETDATLNPGNSGGALVDTDGNLLGMPSLLSPGSGGNAYGFAIAANDIKWSIEKIMSKVDMTRTKLGVKLKPVKNEDQKTHISKFVGLQVISSANSNLLEGDIIVGINDITVGTYDDLHGVLGKTLVGDHYTLTLLRKDQTIRIDMIGSVVSPPPDVILNLDDLLNPKNKKNKKNKNDYEHHSHHKHHYRHHRHFR